MVRNCLIKSFLFDAPRAGTLNFRGFILIRKFPTVTFGGMKTSSYLQQTLSFEQSPATEQYFEVRTSLLFELQGGTSTIEIHVQRPKSDQSLDRWNLVQKRDLKQDFDNDVEPPSPVDWHRYSRVNPPHYVGWPGLDLQRVSNAEDLERITSVRKLMLVSYAQADVTLNERRLKNAFECGMYIRLPQDCSQHYSTLISYDSFIRQRHSYSRLQVTRGLFEALMSQFVIFPRFKEFVLLFGAKHGENDIGPPQLRFRRMPAYKENPGCQLSAGFGIFCCSDCVFETDSSRNRVWASVCRTE